MKNAEGYSDPTAGQAIYNDARRRKAHFLIKVILFIVRETGFRVKGRIELEDLQTGQKY